MSETCETCRFWRAASAQINDNRLRGRCLRNAPAPNPQSAGFWEWPSTYDTAWCGEHQPRSVEREQPKEREPGWYWVLTGTGWQPLEWTSNGWAAGDDEWWGDDALGGIDTQRIVRGRPA